MFCPDSVDAACYGALILANSPTKCDVHLVEGLFQICSGKGEKKQSIFSYFPEHYWVLEFNLFSFQTPLPELCGSREKQVRRGVKGCLN
ncbi:MAG: DUF6783 domain-containing protein [Ruminococcus sp.]